MTVTPTRRGPRSSASSVASLSPAIERGEELRGCEVRDTGDTERERPEARERRDLWNESGYWSSTERYEESWRAR